MSYDTLTNLIDRVAERLSLVGGTSTQTYAEDRIAAAIQHKCDILFGETFWPQHVVWVEHTRDGTLGVVTADLTDLLSDFDDIGRIYPEDSTNPLPLFPHTTMNPNILSGTRPRFYAAIPEGESNDNKVFHIWPKTATGDIQYFFRKHPKTDTAGRLFLPEDTVTFDDHALILGSTFDILEDDGTNPNATQKFQSMFESRMKQLKRALSNAPIALDQGRQNILTTWEAV